MDRIRGGSRSMFLTDILASDLGNGILSNTRVVIRLVLVRSLECLLPESRQSTPPAVGVHIPHVLHHLLPLLHFPFPQKSINHKTPHAASHLQQDPPPKLMCTNRKKKQTRTSRSSWMGKSRSSEIWLRFPADHLRVTVPVNMDQKARSRIAANAQNLYRPLPKTLASELSFFAFVVGAVVRRESPSFIAFNLLDHTEFPDSDSDLNFSLMEH